MQRIIYRLLFFCLLLGSFNSAKAIDEKYAAPALQGSQLTASNATSMVMDTVYFNPALKPLQTTWFVKNLITFQLDESYRHMLPDEFSVSLVYRIHYIEDVNGSPVAAETDTLRLGIEYSKYTSYKQKGVYVDANWYKVEVEIFRVETKDNLNDFLDALVLTNEIQVNREYSFSCTNNTIRQIFANTAPVASKGELNVFWTPERAADEYDLEWTYIDSLAKANYYKANDTTKYDPKKIFANNATRVSITKEGYNIPLLYEASGLLFFRVRAVQVKHDGQRMESVWSSDYSGGLGQYGFKGLDTSLNWQASTSFAEEGKRKSVVQYFDGSLKSRQTVTKDNTTDTTIIAETFYDNQGRPVIQVMPTPSLKSIIKFTPGFNRLNSASEYAKNLYDSVSSPDCYCNTGAPAMDQTQGAAQYYSPNNPLKTNGYHKYIPDANGYVFAETRYTPDNTGRVSMQSGVGETFQIGKGHETVYTYGAADQEELDALFGTEVGNKNHYFKNTVRDANGQVSISYVDMHGRTIATALADSPTVSMDPLPSNNPGYILKKLIDSNSNVIKGTVIESSTGLVVTEAGPQIFKYSMVPDSIGINGCDNKNVCYDCIYDLRITITDECNNTSLPNKQPYVITRTNGPADTACGIPRSLPTVNDTVYLPKGSYLVTKTLTVNQKAMDYYRDSVFLVRNTCRTLEQTIQEQKNRLDTLIQCEPSCAACRASLGSWETYRNNYMQQAGIPNSDTAAYRDQAAAAYKKEQDECQQLCDGIIPLQVSIRSQMLADVTPPYGQYANPDNPDPYSIFWSRNGGQQPAYNIVTGTYKDENGKGEVPDPRNLWPDIFVASFKDSWAETLLEMHPEYPKLVQLDEFATSNTWDQQFGKTETFQEAVAKGYLNPGDFGTHPAGSNFSYNWNYRDPFFTDYIETKISTEFKDRMQDSLQIVAFDANNHPVSMWSMATMLAHCGAADAVCMDHFRSMDSAFAIGTGCSGELDMAWKYFREMYLQKKRELIADILRSVQRGSPYEYYRDLRGLVNSGHHLNFYDPNLMPTGDMPTTAQAVKDSIQLYINDNCTAFVNQWWKDLGPCNYNSTDSAWIIPKLIAVCREGGDSDHFFGASTVKPSSTYQYKSFEEVLKAYSANNPTRPQYNAACNVYLISAPLPYDQQPVFTNKPVFQKPDSCECANIATLYQQYQADGKASSFADYLYRTTQTVVSNGTLDTLRMACNGQITCNFLQAPVFLPPVLQCGVKDVCVPCSKFTTLYNQYLDQFPNATPAQENGDSLQMEKNRLFERFMNTNLGFGKDVNEYLAFMESCNIKHEVHCGDSLDYILNQFNTIYKNPSMYTPGGQYKGDTTDYYIDPKVSWIESVQRGVVTYPARITSNPGGIDYYYMKPMLVPENGLSIEARIKTPLLDSNCRTPDFQIQLRPDMGRANAEFFTKSSCRPFGAFDLTDSIGRVVTAHNEMSIDMRDWVKMKMTILKNKYQIFVADTLLLEVPYTGTITRLNQFGLFFGTYATSARSAPAVDYIKVYNGCNDLVFDQEFDSVNAKACPDLSVRVAPDDYKTVFTNYYNQFRSTNFTVAQIDSIYNNSCGLKLNSCPDTSLIRIKNEFVNNYFNYGRKYDSNGCDTVSWKVDFGGWNNNTKQPHKNIFKNGIAQYPDTLSLSYGHRGVAYDHYVSWAPNDSACINGYVNFEVRMKDTLAPWETYHKFRIYLYFSPNLDDQYANQYIFNVNKIDTYWNYVHMMTAGRKDSVAINVSEFHQVNYNGWHTLNLEVKDSLLNYYVDKQLVKSIAFHNFPREKFYGYSLSSDCDSNLSIAYDYVKCYDRNGNLFYDEEFNDCGEFARFAPYIQCPKQPCKEAFTAYYNKVKQTNKTWSQIDNIYAANGISLNICDTTEAVLCGKSEPVIVSNAWKPRTNCDDSTLFATSTGVLLYDAYRDSLLGSFNDRYLAKCLNARYNESFTVYQPVSEFHYTLYYYDQAGNLLKTVPPEGVDVSKFAWARAWSDSVTIARRNRQVLTPKHKLPTQYRYNTLNQVLAQQSPDGGLSEFWYDRLGRLAISRNARQKGASATEDNRLYSYTKYDSLGRITEVGQVSNTNANGAMSETVSRNQPLLNNWLLTLNNRRGQITNTVYDLPYPGFVGLGDPRMVIEQRNLRNRVSYTTLSDTGFNNVYSSGTFYTYDILGNVDQLLQDYGSPGNAPNVMNKRYNEYKKIRYQYDLISGKVNMVTYQPGYVDAFFHRYSYDAENRLMLVETSSDSLVWDKDARYDYYRHGPLARITLGDQQVQGLDYAYTLQGWLKGINSTGGTETVDMGEDGNTGSQNQFTARDALGLTLNYFGDDYTAINGTPFPAYSGYMPTGAFKPLYNGNISSSSVYQKKFDYSNSPGGPLIFYNYQYDQLNRLTGQDAYNGFNSSSNSWSGIGIMGTNGKERIAYDANGNIKKYLRNSFDGTNPQMDSLNYYYYPGTNQLKRVTDSLSANAYVNPDIQDIDGQPDSNYVYDAIGNLIKDSAEKITRIKWNVYGKIQEIDRIATTDVPASNIKYTYDALGNRISQVVTSNGTKYYTWYVRDAQGNILTTYTAEGNNTNLADLTLKLGQRFLYGSSRLGLISVDDTVVNSGPGRTEFMYQYRDFAYDRGHKQYELTNHLGNVLATISDRKFGVTSGSSSLIDHYEPHIVTAQDYYPFGMLSRVSLPGSNVPYTFGFNGKLNDNEVKGLGNQQDYGMRVYDPRVGRFLSVDPITKQYPQLTPYQFASNRPIDGVDRDGLEWAPTPEQEKEARFKKAMQAYNYLTSRNASQKQQAAGLNLPPPNQNATFSQGAGSGQLSAEESMRLKNQKEHDKEMQRRADADPISYGGPGFGRGLVRDPFIQGSAFLVCPECALVFGGMEVYSGVQTGNKREIFTGSLNLIGGGIGVTLRWTSPKIDLEASSWVESYNKSQNPALDCSEMAADINNAVKGGQVFEIRPKTGKWMNGIEYGETTEFQYHQFYAKDGYVYDPMFGSKPVPWTDFIKQYSKMNNGQIKIQPINK